MEITSAKNYSLHAQLIRGYKFWKEYLKILSLFAVINVGLTLFKNSLIWLI